MTDLLDLPTPAALVDLDTLQRNCRRMAEKATRLGVRLRPHVKTHKCPRIAQMQVQGHFGGITVSTLAEARTMADAGFRDITYAVPLAPQRATEAAGFATRVDVFNVLVDSAEAIAALIAVPSATLSAAKAPLGVFLKVDCGYHRAGVDPLSPRAIELARRLHEAPHLRFEGLLTHAGHAYSARDPAGILAVAEIEAAVPARLATTLRELGIPVPHVSVGSTPTMAVAEHLPGVTEIRPGNYVFFDDYQLAIGSCRPEDRAFSVLTTVVGCYPERSQLVVDAGALALSKDRGAGHAARPTPGFGSIVHAVTNQPVAELALTSLSQEHGVIQPLDDAEVDLESFPVGTRLRIFPQHSCLAAAQHPAYHGVRDGVLLAHFEPCRGW